MKRVLIFTYYWPPSGGAGVQRWLKFSKFLPEFGWEPIIITVDPEKATYPVLDASLEKEINNSLKVIKTDSNEWFSFYKKVSGSEKVPYAGFANETRKISLKQKAARFVRGNFFLPDPRKGWNKYAEEAARKIINETKIDCIISTGPPHSSHLIGLEISKEFHIPWIADFRDPWTDIYYYEQFYPTRLANKINRKKELSILQKSDAVLTVGPSLQKMLAEKIPGHSEKVKVLTNGFDPDDFKELPNQKNKRFIVTYVGTMADMYPLEPFLDAFKDLVKENSSMLFRCIGTISPQQRGNIMQLPDENIELIPYVNHRTAIEYMSDSSVLLLIIPSHSSSKSIITGKLFEYLAVGKPILLLGPVDGDAAIIVNQGKSGTAINPDSTKEIYAILSKWVRKCPNVETNISYSRNILTKKLIAFMDQLSPGNHSK